MSGPAQTSEAAGPAALVVMAKAPRAGHVKTRLCPPLAPAEAAALADAFLRDALDVFAAWAPGAGASVRLYLDAEPPAGLAPDGVTVHRQAAGGLGARMLRAVVESAAAGARRIVLVGTDHPMLPPAFLSLAVDALAHPRTAVLGPTGDGGYYLLGLNEIVPHLFAMDYSHDRVFADTLDRAAEAGLAPVVLPPHDDVDDAAGLDRLAAAWRGGADVGAVTARFLQTLTGRPAREG